jgi:hypothetical protein
VSRVSCPGHGAAPSKAVIATKVRALHAQGIDKIKIAKTLGIGTSTVRRILA